MEMIASVGGTDFLTVESETLVVVFDPATGDICHVRRTLVHRGADAPSVSECEARALERARELGHDDAGLDVMVVDPAAFRMGVPQRVDTKTRRLVAIDTSAETIAARGRRSPTEGPLP